MPALRITGSAGDPFEPTGRAEWVDTHAPSPVWPPRDADAVAAKQAVRQRVWALLERERVARFPGARGRIPNFVGAERAAERLAELAVWQTARVVKANPDAPQLPVRRRALAEGKRVYMAVPRLRAEKPFVLLESDATIAGAMKTGRPTALDELGFVDLVVCGSVAVNRSGVRVGKGGGYSDLELALLREVSLIGERTALVTTVHPLQMLDEDLPETEHDFRVDVVVTPDEAIVTPGGPRPPGILWHRLDPDRVAAMPPLARLARARRP
jgi:5-formyltetrahydrofolate cyclo-ligase